MAEYIENVVVGNPPIKPETIFSNNSTDWETNEKHKTVYTNERFLPRIMKEVGIVNSVSEIKRNRPDLCVVLGKNSFFKIKWGKKFLFILVGADNE